MDFGGSQTLVPGVLSAVWDSHMLPTQGFQDLSALKRVFRYFHSCPQAILPDAILLLLLQQYCITINIGELQVLDMEEDTSLVRCDPVTVCPSFPWGIALIKKCKSGKRDGKPRTELYLVTWFFVLQYRPQSIKALHLKLWGLTWVTTLHGMVHVEWKQLAVLTLIVFLNYLPLWQCRYS